MRFSHLSLLRQRSARTLLLCGVSLLLLPAAAGLRVLSGVMPQPGKTDLPLEPALLAKVPPKKKPHKAPPPKPTPPPRPVKVAMPSLDLELDLELETAEKVVQRLKAAPSVLEKALAENSELAFAWGYALQRTGQHEQALPPLTAYHDAKGKLAPYAALLLGESCLELRQLDNAARWLGEARGAFPSGEREVQTRLLQAQVSLAKGDSATAIHDLEALLSDAPRSPRRFKARVFLAQALEQAGQQEASVSAWEWLWAWAPETREADQAGLEMVRLQEARAGGYAGPNTAVRYRRALRLLKAGQVEPGLSLMLSLAQDSQVASELPRNFTFELAKAYFQAKQYSDAARLLDEWYRRATAAERSEALYWRALCRGRLARHEEAIELYRQILREYPKTEYAEIGLYKTGLLRIDQGRYQDAFDIFAVFRERYPKAQVVDNAQWYMAWSAMRLGRLADGSAAFEELIKRYPRSPLVAGARYWQGRIAAAQQNNEGAAGLYKQVLAHPVPSHYAPLAELRLERLGMPVVETPAPQPTSPREALVLPHPEMLERTVALLSIGLRTWAQEELSRYEHTLKGREDFLALADWYYRTGNYARARLIAANLGLGEGVPRLRDPSLTYQLSYPLAYKDRLGSVVLPPRIPWELIYGVMRQESEFRPWATSRANARGLMQVIPETAREVCTNRHLPLPDLSTLYQPQVSVQFGAWHLEDLMSRLKGRLPLVIAGYNAGPEAVERWIAGQPVDPIDVFIEEISFAETRRYVRKVLTNLWIYRRLYADGKTPLRDEPRLDAPLVAPAAPHPVSGESGAVSGGESPAELENGGNAGNGEGNDVSSPERPAP